MTKTQDPRQRAYQAGARIARERIEKEAPLDAAVLADVRASDIVVVGGCYDHVELVLTALDTPFTAITPEQFDRVALRPEQLLVINCPGQLSPDAVLRTRDFVVAGGSLFSTDWALRHVIEPAFPNTIAFNERPTRDDVVRVEIAERDNPFLRGVIDPGEDPLWWLEASSYPIKVLDADRVQVLVRSSELGQKYGEAPVAILFGYEKGEVFHMISHYYLQRTELRDARHNKPAADYAMSKGVTIADDLAGLSLGDVESAVSSNRFMANVMVHHKRRVSKDKAED